MLKNASSAEKRSWKLLQQYIRRLRNSLLKLFPHETDVKFHLSKHFYLCWDIITTQRMKPTYQRSTELKLLRASDVLIISITWCHSLVSPEKLFRALTENFILQCTNLINAPIFPSFSAVVPNITHFACLDIFVTWWKYHILIKPVNSSSLLIRMFRIFHLFLPRKMERYETGKCSFNHTIINASYAHMQPWVSK